MRLGVVSGAPSDRPDQPALFAGLATGVSRIGRRLVAGEPTTLYHATLDYSRAARLPAAMRLGGAALAKRIAPTGGRPVVPIDAFVDARGRLRRLVTFLRMLNRGVAGRTYTASFTITADYTELGRPVSVTIPSAADTRDVTADIERRNGRLLAP